MSMNKEFQLPDIFLLPDDVQKSYNCYPGIDRLKNLSKVNIFVGPNNTGKSRLLRKLFITQNLAWSGLLIEKDKSKSEFIDLLNKIREIGYQQDRNKEFSTTHGKDCESYYKLDELLENLIINPDALLPEQYKLNKGDTSFYDKIKSFSTDKRSKLAETLKTMTKNVLPKPERIYIPVLRGLRPFQIDSDKKEEIKPADLYSMRTEKDYFSEKTNKLTENIKLFTGLEMYYRIRASLLGERKRRVFIREYEDFLKVNFFEGKEITIIPKEGEDVLTIKIGNETERSIFNIGDGIQQLMIFTFPMFENKEEKFAQIFIEEPELYLHPGLQRILLNLMTSDQFPNQQYFLTTHSNHLLEITQDMEKISIYRFTKILTESKEPDIEAKFNIENVSSGNRTLLDCLGVANSSVFLSNCTIWVEGITDRLYIRKYLELYNAAHPETKKYSEDLHYSFLEYSGSNIAHYSFLDKEEKPINFERLCGTIFLICDRDEDKEERFENLRDVLDDRFHVLDSIEIENLLSKEIIIQIVKSYESNDVELNSNFTEKTYKKKKLGRFIEDRVLKDKTRSKRIRKTEGGYVHPYSEKSGTIKDKLTFAQKAISYLNDYDDLSDEAKQLTEKIYAFIDKNNTQEAQK